MPTKSKVMKAMKKSSSSGRSGGSHETFKRNQQLERVVGRDAANAKTNRMTTAKATAKKNVNENTTKPRLTSPPPASSKGGGGRARAWCCVRCTLLNFGWRKTCQACGTSRDPAGGASEKAGKEHDANDAKPSAMKSDSAAATRGRPSESESVRFDWNGGDEDDEGGDAIDGTNDEMATTNDETTMTVDGKSAEKSCVLTKSKSRESVRSCDVTPKPPTSKSGSGKSGRRSSRGNESNDAAAVDSAQGQSKSFKVKKSTRSSSDFTPKIDRENASSSSKSGAKRSGRGADAAMTLAAVGSAKMSNASSKNEKPFRPSDVTPKADGESAARTSKSGSKRKRRSKSKEKRASAQKRQMVDFIEEEQKRNNSGATPVPSATERVDGTYPAEILLQKGGDSTTAAETGETKRKDTEDGGPGSDKLPGSKRSSLSSRSSRKGSRAGSKRADDNASGILERKEEWSADDVASGIGTADVATGKYERSDDDAAGGTVTEADADVAQSRKVQDDDNTLAAITLPDEARKGGDEEIRAAPSGLAQDPKRRPFAESEPGDAYAAIGSDEPPATASVNAGVSKDEKRRESHRHGEAVLDVVDASSTASAKWRRADLLAARARCVTPSEITVRQTGGAGAVGDDNPASDDWIEEMASAARLLERTAAAARAKFDGQRRHYESLLEMRAEEGRARDEENAQLRKELEDSRKELEGMRRDLEDRSLMKAQAEESRAREEENARLRKELEDSRKEVEDAGRELEDRASRTREEDARAVCGMKREIEALRVELEEERESSKKKDAIIESTRGALRSLL